MNTTRGCGLRTTDDGWSIPIGSSPLATLDEEVELLFSNPLHEYLTEYDFAQHTVNRPKQHPMSQSERIPPAAAHRMDPGNGTHPGRTQTQAPRARGVTVGTLNKEGTSPEGKGS